MGCVYNHQESWTPKLDSFLLLETLSECNPTSDSVPVIDQWHVASIRKMFQPPSQEPHPDADTAFFWAGPWLLSGSLNVSDGGVCKGLQCCPAAPSAHPWEWKGPAGTPCKSSSPSTLWSALQVNSYREFAPLKMPFKINLCKNSEFYFRNGCELKCLEVSFHDNLRTVFQNQLVIVIYIS